MSTKPEVVAALFVHPGGVYYDQPGVDPWDEARDARKYPGPFPVIAHPPCKRWGNFSRGTGRSFGKFVTGDDDGCFASALASVRRFGGILEHPAYSKAWPAFGLPRPGGRGTWTEPDEFGGRSICVWQSEYGHKCSKPTWLYGVNINFNIAISGGKTSGTHQIGGDPRHGKPNLKKEERHLTPEPFRDLLLSLVRGGK